MTEFAEKPKMSDVKAREVTKRLLRHETALFVGILLAVVAVFAGMTRGKSLAPDNVMSILFQGANRGIATIGQLFVVLTAGIDLSVGGLATLTSVVAALLTTDPATPRLAGHVMVTLPGTPLTLPAMIPLVLLVGTAVGLFSGLSVSRIHMPAIIVTLAVWLMTRGGAYRLGGGYSVSGLPPQLEFFGNGTVAGVPTPVIAFVIVAVLGYFVLNHTTFGRSVYASGANASAAWLSGVGVVNIRLAVYAISGFLAALVGFITTARQMSGSVMGGQGLEIDSIAAVAVGGVSLAGGKGTVVGAVIGAIVISTINNGLALTGVQPVLRDIVKGGIIFAAVVADTLRRRSS